MLLCSCSFMFVFVSYFVFLSVRVPVRVRRLWQGEGSEREGIRETKGEGVYLRLCRLRRSKEHGKCTLVRERTK